MTLRAVASGGSSGSSGLTIGSTAITGGTPGRLLWDNAGVVDETNGATWDATNRTLTVGGATVTANNPVLNLTQTWNNGAIGYDGIALNITNTASAGNSNLINLKVGNVTQFSVAPNGVTSAVSGFFTGNLLAHMSNTNGFVVGGTVIGYSFTNGSTTNGTRDTQLSRNAAGVVEVNNGTAGQYRDMLLRALILNPVTVANLPGSPVTGMMAIVTDANAVTPRSTVAGGGSNQVIVQRTASAWIIVG